MIEVKYNKDNYNEAPEAVKKYLDLHPNETLTVSKYSDKPEHEISIEQMVDMLIKSHKAYTSCTCDCTSVCVEPKHRK